MSRREEIFARYGPLLMEASTHVILDEINTLRSNQGFPPITELQFYEKVMNHFATLEDFDFLGGPND